MGKTLLTMQCDKANVEGDCLDLQEFGSAAVLLVLKAITVSVLDEDAIGLPQDMGSRIGLVLNMQDRDAEAHIPLSDSLEDVNVLKLLQKLGCTETLRRLKQRAAMSLKMGEAHAVEFAKVQ